MSVTVRRSTDDAVYHFYKGSFEAIVDRCSHVMVGYQGEERVLDATTREQIRLNVSEISLIGLRCLFFAYSRSPDLVIDGGLTFVGFVGMQDPPRPGVSECISRLLGGGVRIIMITGDSGNYDLAVLFWGVFFLKRKVMIFLGF